MPIFSGSKVSLVSLVIRKTTTGGLDLAWRILYKLEFSEIYSPLQLLIFNFLGYKKGIQMLKRHLEQGLPYHQEAYWKSRGARN